MLRVKPLRGVTGYKFKTMDAKRLRLCPNAFLLVTRNS